MITLDEDILVKNVVPIPVNNRGHLGVKTSDVQLAMSRMVMVFFLLFTDLFLLIVIVTFFTKIVIKNQDNLMRFLTLFCWLGNGMKFFPVRVELDHTIFLELKNTYQTLSMYFCAYFTDVRFYFQALINFLIASVMV
jgi:hypothetical protein